MIKKSIRLPLISFLASTTWQLFTAEQVKWVDNLAISFIVFLIIIFYNWSKVPYEWKKSKNE